MVKESSRQRIVDAATDFCFHLLPKDILKKLKIPLPENPNEDDIENATLGLFEVKTICGEFSISIEILSPYRKIRGILIGGGGKNVGAVRHLIQVIGRQERIDATQITVVRKKHDDNKEEGE